MKKILPVILLLSLAFVSCEKLMMPKKKSVKASAIFNDIWTKLDQGYVYFGKKNINWDTMKIIYGQVFVDSINDQQLFDSTAVMLNTVFKDASLSLYSGFGTSYYRPTEHYPANFRKDILERNYWPGYEKTGPLLYKVIDSVGYIYYQSFREEVSKEQMNVVISRLKDRGGKSGTIIDIRNNDGGDPKNMEVFLDHLGPDSNTAYDYSAFLYEVAYKSGPGHDEIDSYKGRFKDKNENSKFSKRVIILTNRGVYGTANVFAGAAKAFGNVKLMGDTTGGGGTITSSFELANGWILTYPSARIRTGDGRDMDEGIPPFYVVQMKKDDEDAGKDTMIEAALAQIANP